MKFTSYAQNFEDIMLWRAVGHIAGGRYVDVGAQHPVFDSVSKGFYELGWRGVHFEPVPFYAELLRQDRPEDSVLQVALSDSDGVTEFNIIPDTGLSTAVTAYAQSHEQSRGFAYQTVQVPMMTMKSALASLAGQEVHWLKIDVEGLEEQVLRGWDSEALRPWIIVIEATVPLSTEQRFEGADRLLVDARYQFAYFDGLNRFYVAAEHPELLPAFRTPPNVFDEVQLTRFGGPWCHDLNAGLTAANESLKEQLAALQRRLDEASARMERLSAEGRARAAEAESMLAQLASRIADTAGREAVAEARSMEADRRAQQAQLRAQEAEERAAHSSGRAARLELEETQAKAHAAALASQLEDVEGSLSWRLTSPFRAVHPGLRKFEKALRQTPVVSSLRRKVKRAKARRQSASPTTVDSLGSMPSVAGSSSAAEVPLADVSPRARQIYQQLKSAIGAREGLSKDGADGEYGRWIRGSETWSAPVESNASATPVVSFLLGHPGVPSDLSKTLDSIRAQTQGAWEVIVVGTMEPLEGGSSASLAMSSPDPRVRFIAGTFESRPVGLQAALRSAQGRFVAMLDAGDTLVPQAMNEVLATLAAEPHAEIVYSDEDVCDADGLRDAPYFKPGWSPELLSTFNYFGRLTLLSRSLVQDIGGFNADSGAGVEWDINLRAGDRAQSIERIAKVLCHRAPSSDRERPDAASAAAADHRAVIETYWRGKGFAATASTRAEGTQRVTWPMDTAPVVSIIIPTKDKVGLLRTCVDGLLSGTDYPEMEIVLVDTGSRESATWAYYDELRSARQVRIVHFDRVFNYSAACNHGAASARGEMLLFLNNDIEVKSRDWLQEMVRYLQRPDVGVVGAKLEFPSGELQHGGVGIGIHLCALMYRSAGEQGWNLFGSADHPRNWLAIMGACQMVRRDVFDLIGGFDESYRIAMSDVALCVRAWRAGYRTAFAADALLVHHEGATRGNTNPVEDVRRVADDLRAIGIDEDPYLHPGLDGRLAIPTLRQSGAPSVREELATRLVADGSAPTPNIGLDLADEGRCIELAGLPRNQVLWLPQAAHKVNDIWSAARWCLDLLRCRPDLHRRFPRALSSGADGDFARWLKNEGAVQRRLPPSLITAIDQLLATDISANARRAFFFDTAYRQAMPQGLTPAGLRESFRWFMQNRARLELRLEEVWWLIWTAQENPELELVRAYLFTPQWQRLYPDGVTIFGRRAFAHWFAAHYRVSAEWVDAVNWPLETSASRQLRRAYGARPDWRERHPRALDNAESARGLLAWLRSGEAMLSEEARAWCLQLDGDTVVSELVSPGVNVMGHFCYPSGLRVSVEALVGGLKLAGVQTALRDVRTDKKDDPHHLLFDSQEDFDITVIHTQPEPFFDEVYERCDLAERSPRSYRIAYWYWEFDAVPPSWAKQAAQVDEVWAATEFVAKGLRSLLTIPVKTVFPGVKLAAYERRSLAHFGLEEGPFTFLFTFHMMSIMERKNPLGLIRAFQLAFKPTDNVRLVLKTSFGDRHPAQMRELREAAAGSNITIIDQLFSPDEVLSLMDACDAYVSLHRSEGLGLTMAEAMLMGKPVIATNYSGNVAFMDESNSLPVDYTLVKVGRPIPPYDAESEWAEPSTEHAAQLMKRVVADPAWARELGARAKASADLRLSLTTSGRVASIRLTQIAAERAKL